MSACDTEILSESRKDNREILKIIQLSSQELVRLKGNEDFYDEPKNADKFINIISGNCEISIRLIDHFVTKYSKFNKCTYKLNEEEKEINFNVHYDYKNQLKHYQKTYFDPFSRGDRIPFFMNNTCIITTIGQLNFFKWALENKVVDFIEQNYETIEKDMNNRNSTSKRKELAFDNSKTRKKREELSVSATKSIKKEKVEIVLQFH